MAPRTRIGWHLSEMDGQPFILRTPGVWTPYPIPVGCIGIQILVLGAGGGGGGGCSGAAGASRGGGGGGASGCAVRLTLPTAFLQDALYLYAGAGGAGGAGQAGSTGDSTVISAVCGSANAQDVYLVTVGGGGGALGTSSGSAEGGAIATLPTITPLGAIGTFLANASLVGAAGGAANVAGSNIAIGATQIVSGGSGGGGITSTVRGGGSLQAMFEMAAVASATASGASGAPGSWLWRPLLHRGGGGGASANSTPGGNGGDGANGCGGGGGAGGNGGGAGGRGGNALIMITAW